MTRILIVDDNEKDLYMLEVLLKGCGYEVVPAVNGLEALEKARNWPPDLIAADIMMPVMDGFSLCREWKKDDRLKPIPFVFYTATYTDAEDEELALNLGAERFIAKPQEPEALMRMLEETIEEHRSGRLAAPRKPIAEEPAYLREYSARLVKKLEDKVQELRDANQALQEEIRERKRVQAELAEKEQWFRNAFEQAAVGIAHLTPDGRFLEVNQWLCDSWGYTRQELLERTFRDVTHPDDLPEDIERAGRLGAGEFSSFLREKRYIRKDGAVIWGNVAVSLVRGPAGEPKYRVAIVQDITKRKQSEERLQAVNRSLKALSECNAALVRAETEQELLDEICRVLASAAGYRLVWVGLAEQDERKTVRPVAQTGYEEGYLATLNVTWADDERGRCPTGTAVRTRKPCVARNILTDSNFAPWRADALTRGYASSLALPLLAGGQVLGALNVYAVSPGAFDAEEVSLLSELAGDLAYGVQALRTRAEHAQAGELQRVLNRLLEVSLQDLPLGEQLQRAVEVIVAAPFLPLENRGGVFLVEDGQQMLTLTAQVGLLETIQSLCHQVPFGRCLCGRAAASRQIEFAVSVDERHENHYDGMKDHGHYCVPVVARDRVLGVLTLYVQAGHQQRERETDFLTAVAHALAGLIERKRADAALRESERRLSALADNLPGMIYRCLNDATWTMEFVSYGCVALTGYSPKELSPGGKLTYADVIVPEDRQAVWNTVRHAVDQRSPYTIEYRITPAGGGIKWVWERGAGVYGLSGELIALEGFVTDITERVRMEGERMRLVMAIAHAAEAIIMTDAKGTIEYVNAAFLRITGYAREEAIGQNPRILKSGKHDAAFYEHLWDTISHGAVWSGRMTNMRKNGALYEQEATISPVCDKSGHVVNYVAIARDISQQVFLEDQLRQAQKLEAIGTLAGGIAHDFNNILAAIVGYSEIAMQDQPPGSETYDCLQEVLKAGERAKELVQQILAFSRRGKYERQPMRMEPVVKEVLKLLRGSLPSTIEIRQDIESSRGLINADPIEIHQIVMNLCTNAYHAMRAQGGTLTVRLSQTELGIAEQDRGAGLAPGLYVRLSVSDTGCGMDEATTQRMFEPYFTTKEQGEGTGLGLSTVHGIVTSCSGGISVTSSPGAGTTFDILLPVCGQDAHEPVGEGAQAPVPGGHERVLYVDDEVTLAEMGERALSRLGYKVSVHTSSLAALAAFKASPDDYDIVIVDQTMPKMTGLDLAKELHQVRPGLPVILCSGFSETATDRHLQEAGIAEYLMKPVPPRDLATAIRRVLDR